MSPTTTWERTEGLRPQQWPKCLADGNSSSLAYSNFERIGTDINKKCFELFR